MDFFQFLVDNDLVTAAFVIGAIFVFVALVGKINPSIEPPPASRAILGVVGVLLMLSSFISHSMSEPDDLVEPPVSALLTPTVLTAVTQPSVEEIDTPTPVVLAQVTPSVSSQVPEFPFPFIWQDAPVQPSEFYADPVGGWLQYSFEGQEGMRLRGRYTSDRVWINKVLPENFRVEVAFKLLEPDCAFSFGVGRSWEEEYHVAVVSNYIALKEVAENVAVRNYTVGNIGETLEVTLQRNHGAVEVHIGTQLVLEVEKDNPGLANLDDYDSLFFYTGNSDKPRGCEGQLVGFEVVAISE